MSLRARLVAVVLVLLGSGLIASAVATSTLLRSYLYGQVDTRLTASSEFAARVLLAPPTAPPPSQRAVVPSGRAFTDTQAARIDVAGRVRSSLVSPFSAQASDALAAVPSAVLARARRGEVVRLDVHAHGRNYRAVVRALPRTTDVAVVLTSLRDVEATLSRLYRIEVIATVVLMLLAAASAWVLVRIGLRPLRSMADAADAVAAGQVDERVAVRGGAEVARLGHALNNAFDARAQSEHTLRAFISDASHELRTPLTSIRGYAELLLAGALTTPREINRAVGRIHAEAARTGVLVEDLLALARLDEGRPLCFDEVDLVLLAADAVHDARAVEPERTITLIAPEPIEVVADEAGVRRVFANLLENARLHTDVGGAVEVTVRRSGVGAEIHVVDEGPGLSEHDRLHAFDRFWRATQRHRDRDDKGTGLGLAIVAAVAHAHGGHAYIANGTRPGAHFVVALPALPRGHGASFTSNSQATSKVR